MLTSTPTLQTADHTLAAQLLTSIARHCQDEALRGPHPSLTLPAAEAAGDANRLRKGVSVDEVQDTFKGGPTWFEITARRNAAPATGAEHG